MQDFGGLNGIPWQVETHSDDSRIFFPTYQFTGAPWHDSDVNGVNGYLIAFVERWWLFKSEFRAWMHFPTHSEKQ